MSLKKTTKYTIDSIVIIIITFSIMAIDIDNLFTQKSILGFVGILIAMIALFISYRK